MLPLTKNELKFFIKLHRKKHREEENLFLIQGEKLIDEAIKTCPGAIQMIIYKENLPNYNNFECRLGNNKDFERLSTLTSPPGAIAVMKYLDTSVSNLKWTLVLDEVKDPGNLGTIIRIADWFGYSNIVCSENTVDIYNPKTVQSSMGSLFRVSVEYKNLKEYLSQDKRAIFKADLEGENVNTISFPTEGVLILGSESHGITDDIKDLGSSIKIPGKGSAESLNVAVAGGIISSYIFN